LCSAGCPMHKLPGGGGGGLLAAIGVSFYFKNVIKSSRNLQVVRHSAVLLALEKLNTQMRDFQPTNVPYHQHVFVLN